MVNVTRLYCGISCSSDALRYGDVKGAIRARVLPPVVVWNITNACNLRCIHCYSDSKSNPCEGELTTDEAKALIDELCELRIPRLLISGGEPLMRTDLFELLAHAARGKLNTALSTNGTLIDSAVAEKLKECGVRYIGVSLDGVGSLNDEFRGVGGAFKMAVEGIKGCKAVGLRTGIRMTLTRHTVDQIDAIFDLAIGMEVDRLCFYHFIPSGRGRLTKELSLSGRETRLAVERIMQRTAEIIRSGILIEVLTVDNPVDGAFIYLKMMREGNQRASEVYELLRQSGGAFGGSGVGIACIDHMGNVHPDQFWRHHIIGNVRSAPFRKIWFESDDELMHKLRERWKYIHGRCSWCRFLEICGGGMRVRADVILGDAFASDPGCYLGDDEIADAHMDKQLVDSRQTGG